MKKGFLKMLYKVTQLTFLIVIITCVIWAVIINLESKVLNQERQKYLPERIASPSQVITRSPSESLDSKNSWLEERAHVYRDRLKGGP